MTALRSGIIGGGFMAEVHAHAVRAAGGVVTHVAGRSPEAADESRERLHATHAAASVEELVHCDDVDLVHVCTPNALHAEQAGLVLAAGKPVICEKPLATSPKDAQQLAWSAAQAGVLATVPFVYRYYPAAREARARIAANGSDPLWLLHGSYLQDWLSDGAETNWRVDSAHGGQSRAFGDIGVHWCDLMEFVTGHRIIRLSARLAHAFGGRSTEDGALVQFETDRGAAGSVTVSQVSPGRKNRLWFSFDGRDAGYVFDQEQPESLWIGGREDNRLVPRGSQAMSPGAGRTSRLPAGHPQGYQDCFNAYLTDVHTAVTGSAVDGLPTFEDGLRAATLTAAVLESAAHDSWVPVDA